MSTLPFQPSCPLGGLFYVCSSSSSKFVGCCASDPCSSGNGCSAGNLQPASFNATKYGTFSDQECSAGLFYTCAATTPPFLGCCKSNPCSQGSCPTDDLASAFLSGDPGKAASFLGTVLPEGSSSTATTSSSTSLVASPSASSTPMALTQVNRGSKFSTGAIVGLSVAVFVMILALTAAFMYICGRRHARKSVAAVQRTGVTFQALPQDDPSMAVAAAAMGLGQRKSAFSPYQDSFTPPNGSQPYYSPRDSALTSTPPLLSQSRHTSTLWGSTPMMPAELDVVAPSRAVEMGPGIPVDDRPRYTLNDAPMSGLVEGPRYALNDAPMSGLDEEPRYALNDGPPSPVDVGNVPQVDQSGMDRSREKWDGRQERTRQESTSGYIAYSPGSAIDNEGVTKI